MNRGLDVGGRESSTRRASGAAGAAALPRLRSGAVVGRAAELAALSRRIDAGSARESGFAFVVGEPGIGKTRLVDEAADFARRRGTQVLRGRAVGAGTSSMRPFIEALLGLARAGWTPPPDLGPYLAVLGRLVPDWHTNGQAAIAPMTTFVYGEAILRVLGRLEAEPTLLILEDLHDADSETIAILEYLLDNVTGAPLTVVCTTRDVPCPALDLAEYARRRDPDALLALHRLDPSGTAELVAALLETETDGLDDELQAALVRDGVGNPLVITEILRELVASGALVRRDGAWTSEGLARLLVPRSLALSVAEYLRRAQPVARRVLQAAAVLGGEFPAHLVALIARVGEEELWPALGAAVREHFLVPSAHEDWLAFRHPLLERAVVDQLADSVRRELALAAAVAIENSGPATREWRVRAAELRESADDVAGAGRLYAAAGRDAAENGSPALAAELLRRALACTAADRRDAAWAESTGALLAVLGVTGRYEEALGLVADVEAAQRAGLSGTPVADLHIRFARLALRAGLPDRVASHVRAVSENVPGTPTEAQRAELDAIAAFMAHDAHASSQTAEVEGFILKAIETARAAALPTLECDALISLAYHCGIQRQEQTLEYCHQAYRLAREHNLTAQQCEVLILLGVVQWYWQVDGSGLETAIREASTVGAVVETRFAELSLALAEITRGRFDEAQRIVEAAWDDVKRLRMPKVGRYALAVQAVIHAHRGHENGLAATVAEFDAWRGTNEDELPHVHGLALGMSALLQGDLTAARTYFDGLRAVEGASRITKYYICGEYGLALLVEAVDGTADWDRYHAITAHTASEIPWNRQFVECARAVLAGRDGDRAEAERAITRALTISEPFPLARHLALRLLSASAAEYGWGEPARWLSEAEAYFRNIGHSTAARCCRDRLRELGEPIRQWRPGSPDVPRALWSLGVTSREYEVLRLVARQLTNREIAAELYLSYRTVERHVANLLTKTGSANRRELADYAAD